MLRLLPCIAMAACLAAPAFADGPFDPGQGQNWVPLGNFDSPHGTVRGYIDLSAKRGQPAAMPEGRYLVHLWVVLDRPYDTPDGQVGQIDYFLRVDCPSRSLGDDTDVSYYSLDGKDLSYHDSGKQTYSLSKARPGMIDTKLIGAICD